MSETHDRTTKVFILFKNTHYTIQITIVAVLVTVAISYGRPRPDTEPMFHVLLTQKRSPECIGFSYGNATMHIDLAHQGPRAHYSVGFERTTHDAVSATIFIQL